ANPLLRPTAASVARATERWADEDAAASVGDRRATARALARAPLLTRNPAAARRLALAAAARNVPRPGPALPAPPPPPPPAAPPAAAPTGPRRRPGRPARRARRRDRRGAAPRGAAVRVRQTPHHRDQPSLTTPPSRTANP